MEVARYRVDVSALRDRSAVKRIAASTVLFAAIGLLYALLAPKWYRAMLTVVPARAQRPGIAGALAGDMAGVAASFDASLGSAPDAARIAAVLQSNAVSDGVINRFELQKRYKAKYQENARETLWGHCDVRTLPRPNLVQMTCEDKDPRFAQEMLGYFAELGNQVFRRVSAGSASEEVRFLEKRTAELRAEADGAAARVREFQERYHIIDIDTQARAVVSSLASLHERSISKQLEIEFGRRFSAGDEPAIRQLESQLSVMDRKLRELQEPGRTTPRDAEDRAARRTGERSMFPPALEVPQIRAEFERLYRDRKVAEATLVFAMERLEAARANEARDVSSFQVLDPPVVPTRHSRPARTLVVLASAVFGTAAGLIREIVRAVRGRRVGENGAGCS